MSSKFITKRGMTALTFLALAAASSFVGAVHASSFFLVTPMPGKPGGGQPEAPVTFVLSPGMLPEGMIGKPYSVELGPFLSVTGDPDFVPASVSWSGKSLPAGLTLASNGTITGKPESKDLKGVQLTATALYKAHQATQDYTIVIAGQIFRSTGVLIGNTHTCGITTNGGAACWGSNVYGEMGNGNVEFLPASRPVQVLGMSAGVSAIAAGAQFSCAIHEGAAKCWGWGGAGRLGNGDTSNSPVPVQVSGLTSGVTSIVANASACAIQSGSVWCWGNGGNGQLGNGAIANSSIPVKVAGLPAPASSLSIGGSFACALLTNGTVWCWGANTNKQVDPTNTDVAISSPRQVPGVSGATRIASANLATCAVTASGVQCWGNNSVGQLGRGTSTMMEGPGFVNGLVGAQGIFGMFDGFCATTLQGEVWCWGNNSNAQYGVSGRQVTPAQMPGVTGVSAMGGGNGSLCLVQDGNTFCIGSNGNGQLGTGTTQRATVLTEVLAPV